MTSASGAPQTPAPALLWSDSLGDITEDRKYLALGRTGNQVRPMETDEMSPLPPGSVLQYLPMRRPVGLRLSSGRIEPVERKTERGDMGLAVAVMLPNGWARTLLPAYRKEHGAQTLPFFGYTACGLVGEEIRVAAVQTEDDVRWSPSQYCSPDLARTVKARMKEHPNNRLLEHLSRCALEYQCYNAQNVFYRRWEGAVAVSGGCNSRCLGCISLQPKNMPPSPQERLDFVPTVDEITEIGVPHLESGEAVLSFGQGCEGEPLLKADLIARAIRELRTQTSRGTIHINTNASFPRAVARLVEAGLDSIRVSLNSVTDQRYSSYYRPKAYTFADVEESIRICREAGLAVSLNLLFMPGLNDLEVEMERLETFIRRHRVDQVQMRNLNIDPDYYLDAQPPLEGKAIGVPAMVARLRTICSVGNSTRALKA